jgi:hypothetical protein
MGRFRFRVWDKSESKMYPQEELGSSELFSALYVTEYVTSKGKIVLMQSIGLKDSRGQEIYESDLVVHHKDEKWLRPMEVRWEPGLLSYIPIGGTLSPVNGHAWRVIGNVWQNPDIEQTN